MKQIKDMLFGNAIILIIILIHLFAQDGLITDFFAIPGIILVLYGYFPKFNISK